MEDSSAEQNRGVKFISKTPDDNIQNKQKADLEEQVDGGAVTRSQAGHAIQRTNYSSPGDPGHRMQMRERRSPTTGKTNHK